MLCILIIFILFIILITCGYFYFKPSCGCEAFKPDYSDYNSIDRIQINDKYAYCIGAKPTCKTGLPIKGGLYINGTTYRSNCDDGSNMVCNNTFSNYTSSDEYIWNTPNGTPITFSSTYKGFTVPLSYIPAVINDKLINFYDEKNSIVDTMNKCSLLGLDENNCKKALSVPFTFADTSNNDINVFNNATEYSSEPDVIGSFPSYTEKTQNNQPNDSQDEKPGFSGMYPGLPCIADYGSQIGDNVCNGEIGLIEDDALVCPYYKPICNYRCGSTFGTCSYSK